MTQSLFSKVNCRVPPVQIFSLFLEEKIILNVNFNFFRSNKPECAGNVQPEKSGMPGRLKTTGVQTQNSPGKMPFSRGVFLNSNNPCWNSFVYKSPDGDIFSTSCWRLWLLPQRVFCFGFSEVLNYPWWHPIVPYYRRKRQYFKIWARCPTETA